MNHLLPLNIGDLSAIVDTDSRAERALRRRRDAVANAWALSDELVLIGAGELIPVPGRHDLTYRFAPHTEYFYLTDVSTPGGVLAFDPADGWVQFAAPVTDADRLWTGASPPAPDTVTTRELPAWLERRRGRPIAWLGSVPRDLGEPADIELTERLRYALAAVRRPKDAIELERMRAAERATSAGFAAAVALIAPGVSERELQVELEAQAFRHGGDAMAYETLVGSGPNSAVLHFAPSARRLQREELVLIDAGAEVRGYASDITRTYPVGGELTAEQRELRGIVDAARRDASACCRPGTEWVDVHRTAARTIADGLVAVGLLRGDPDELVAAGAVGLFFPHGVGHLVGLGVRDAGGVLYERRDDPPPYANLRIDLPLAAGMVVTVEPGLYFVPALLQDPQRRAAHRDAVAWERVDRMLGFGGIRIEDNLLITADGYEVLTADVPIV